MQRIAHPAQALDRFIDEANRDGADIARRPAAIDPATALIVLGLHRIARSIHPRADFAMELEERLCRAGV